jgi:hypothetical protein
LDSSGFKIFGEGEWKVKMHGASYHRSWLKVHLVVDSESNEIVDLIVTSCSEADHTVGLAFLDRMPRMGQEILADGAYDGEEFRRNAYNQGITAIVPPPKNAVKKAGEHFHERNEAIDLISLLGGDRRARQLWGRLKGYNHRVKAESAFSRLKRLFGATVFSQVPEAQVVEVWLKAWISNYWLGLTLS